jgi:Bacterial Ig domain
MNSYEVPTTIRRRLSVGLTAGLVGTALALGSVAGVSAAGLVQPPSLSYTINENASLLVPKAAMLAGQPADAYVQTTDLTVSPPEWGKISGDGSGITYVPQTGYVGNDTFSYTVCEQVAEAQPLCMTNFVTVKIGSSGGVGAATGKPRVTPPATSTGTIAAASTDAGPGVLLLIGLAIMSVGALLLVPVGQRRGRNQS